MIQIVHYEKMDKGACKARISIKVEKWGNFIIHGVSVLQKDKAKWISFPARKVQVNGEEKWVPQIEFESGELMKQFSKQVIEAYEAQCV